MQVPEVPAVKWLWWQHARMGVSQGNLYKTI